MRNQLSKREYKYRCKIIAENHLKKSAQRFLDTYKKESYSVRNFSIGICQIGSSAAEATKAFNDMARVLQGVYDSLGCSRIDTQ